MATPTRWKPSAQLLVHNTTLTCADLGGSKQLAREIMDKIVNEKHRAVSSLRDDIPLSVDVMLDQVLAKNPDDRFPNGRAMALALRDCVSSFETN